MSIDRKKYVSRVNSGFLFMLARSIMVILYLRSILKCVKTKIDENRIDNDCQHDNSNNNKASWFYIFIISSFGVLLYRWRSIHRRWCVFLLHWWATSGLLLLVAQWTRKIIGFLIQHLLSIILLDAVLMRFFKKIVTMKYVKEKIFLLLPQMLMNSPTFPKRI